MKLLPNQPAEHRAFTKLAESTLFQTYRNAFYLATGLRLDLSPADEDSECSTEPIRDGNPFCTLLNGRKSCEKCTLSHRDLVDQASHRANTAKCFAGLRESAVPVWTGNQVVGYLRVGQVFSAQPAAEDFEKVIKELNTAGWSREQIEELRKAYFAGQVVDSKRYLGCLTLVSAFALQLSEEVSRLMMVEENTDPPAVIKAKQYINARLDERISLEAVAAHVNVSPFYFCKLFKQAVGMTLTEYVNRRRVEWAKRKLMNPHNRVTEVAYDVGYQSLSQFNRSFLKYAGESPTNFRERARSESALRAA